MHGGLSPDIRTLDQIRVLSRAQEIPHEGAFCGSLFASVYFSYNDILPFSVADLMWSDPDEVENWAVSPRGAGWLFGGSVTQEVRSSFLVLLFSPFTLDHLSYCPSFTQFNHINALSMIARAHQLVQEGYRYMFSEQLVTVWSAPNYCYRCGNLASILVLGDGDGQSDDGNESPSDKEEAGSMLGLRLGTGTRVGKKEIEKTPWQSWHGGGNGGGIARRFIVFDAAEENERDRGMQTRRMVRFSLFLCIR